MRHKPSQALYLPSNSYPPARSRSLVWSGFGVVAPCTLYLQQAGKPLLLNWFLAQPTLPFPPTPPSDIKDTASRPCLPPPSHFILLSPRTTVETLLRFAIPFLACDPAGQLFLPRCIDSCWTNIADALTSEYPRLAIYKSRSDGHRRLRYPFCYGPVNDPCLFINPPILDYRSSMTGTAAILFVSSCVVSWYRAWRPSKRFSAAVFAFSSRGHLQLMSWCCCRVLENASSFCCSTP